MEESSGGWDGGRWQSAATGVGKRAVAGAVRRWLCPAQNRAKTEGGRTTVQPAAAGAPASSMVAAVLSGGSTGRRRMAGCRRPVMAERERREWGASRVGEGRESGSWVFGLISFFLFVSLFILLDFLSIFGLAFLAH